MYKFIQLNNFYKSSSLSLLKSRILNYSKPRSYWHYPGSTSGKDPYFPIQGKSPKYITGNSIEAFNALPKGSITSGSRIFVQSAAMTPTTLLHGLCDFTKAEKLSNVETVHIHLGGEAPHVDPSMNGIIRDNSLFIGPNCRRAVNEGRADFTPIFLSDIPGLFESKDYSINVALVQVSPPDSHGYCSLGVSVDCSRSALLTSDYVIAIMNSHVPRTFGDSHVHLSHLDVVYQEEGVLHEHSISPKNDITTEIGRIIAQELIPDRACLQLGIGAIPDAVLAQLGSHKDLGVHTEMFSDGLLPLIESGVVSNKYKHHQTGKVTSSFAVGSQALYDTVNDNPFYIFLDCSYVNATDVIRKNSRVHSINSAIEVDLTGQIVADSMGERMYSGVGGALDFARGAALSEGGKTIIAFPSVSSHGDSKIVPLLRPGSGVVTTRAHVQYIVTEYGVASLHGKTLNQRAAALIDIAHPDHREDLSKAARKRFGKIIF